ncbi:carbamoyltransferase C-terminal domain-containing protein [Fibrobacterota bacterium]
MIIASLYPCPWDVQDRHDVSAAIIKDDDIYAYEEDKLTTVKSEMTVKFPERSLMMGCKELNMLPSQIDKWIFPTPSESPSMKEQYLFFSWIFKAFKETWKDFEKWYEKHVFFVPHQLSHAALAVYASRFNECAFICQDGGGDLGDPRDLIMGEYKSGEFNIINQHEGLQNICVFHDHLTDTMGFTGNDNGKTSGMAAYGNLDKKLLNEMESLMSFDNGGITFKRERFGRTEVQLHKINPSAYSRFKIFNKYPSNTNILQLGLSHLPQDIAATGEFALHDMFVKYLRSIKSKTSMEKAVFSGGLFQNVSLNYKILESGVFKEVFIPMAPSDSGLSLGAALYINNKDGERKRTETLTPFIGPSFKKEEITKLLDQFRLNYTKEKDISLKAAKLIDSGKIVGWFQGRGEYGPRSLGNRSILADPRDASSKARINQLLKKRDWFMPYAPSILEEKLHEWVDIPHESPYMQIAFKVKKEKAELIPAAIHVDGSSRFHVVNKKENEKYWQLIKYFEDITKIPMVLNTSFNRHGISTISTPRQAIEHLLEGCADVLIMDDYMIEFEQNRKYSRRKISEKPEHVCLKEDCIRRIKDIYEYDKREKYEKYLENLSNFIKVDIKPGMEDEIYIENEKKSLKESIDVLIKKIN